MPQHIMPIISRASAFSKAQTFRRSRPVIPLIPPLPRLLNVAVLAAVLTGPTILAAETTKAVIIENSNWSGSDDLGRKLPTFEETGPPKSDRCVGLFYSLWHKNLRHMPGNFNMTEFLKTRPGFMDFTAHPPGGPDYPEFYWAEPLFGYYRSADPWVIRKHLVLLADAGVDYLIFDTTNAQLYDEELTQLLQIGEELQAKGVKVPLFSFFLNYEPEWKAESLYKNWYQPGKHESMWFRWEGKPLILSPMPADGAKFKEPALLPAVQGYFTWRPTWAFFESKDAPGRWRFMDGHPQHPALGPDGKVEQMCVSKSLGAPLWTNMKTASVSCVPGNEPVYNDQWLSKDAPKGLYFEEQWKVANQVGAPMLMVTGWNEWTAAVWETPDVVFMNRKTVAGQGHMVDQFNMEFNRDIEPMSGGYRDNYYWQFVSNMRRYKGMAPPPAPSPPMTNALEQPGNWADVRPVFRDATGDVANRSSDATVPGIRYADNTSRNDLALAQVARDEKFLFFHVQTAAALTPATEQDWMMLYIDADANPATGWYGYDFLVNRDREGNTCSLERYNAEPKSWVKVAMVPLQSAGNQLTLSIPREILRVGGAAGKLKLDFKWVDNIPVSGDIMVFYGKGDAAPNARFNYRFEEP
jgi:hypothetical protein